MTNPVISQLAQAGHQIRQAQKTAQDASRQVAAQLGRQSAQQAGQGQPEAEQPQQPA